jgi:hypothetical protein
MGLTDWDERRRKHLRLGKVCSSVWMIEDMADRGESFSFQNEFYFPGNFVSEKEIYRLLGVFLK